MLRFYRMNGFCVFSKKLAALPLSPEHGKFLLDSIELDCTAEVCCEWRLATNVLAG